MSRVNFSSGDVIKECVLGLDVRGKYSRVLPIDSEVLSVGTKNKEVVLFYVSKDDSYPKKEKTFYLHPSNEPLPKETFKYYFYVGTIPRLGLHIFELV